MVEGPEADWRRSSLCATGSCVEVAVVGDRVAVRDSKMSRGPVLEFDRQSWIDFLAGIRNREFEVPR